MSFSSETKEELCRSPLSRSCCALAEAYGVLLYCHTWKVYGKNGLRKYWANHFS